MTTIPEQRRPSGRSVCASCREALRLVNRQLGATWVHTSCGSDICVDGVTRAAPTGSDLCAQAPVGAGVGARERGGW